MNLRSGARFLRERWERWECWECHVKRLSVVEIVNGRGARGDLLYEMEFLGGFTESYICNKKSYICNKPLELC